jgi:hypothetical protein
MKYSKMLLLLILVTACEMGPQRSIREWIGYPADDMVRIWGPPASSYQFQNGEKVIQYNITKINKHEGRRNKKKTNKCDANGENCKKVAEYSYTPPRTEHRHCMTRFNASPDGIIREVVQEGDCYEFFPDKLPPLRVVAMPDATYIPQGQAVEGMAVQGAQTCKAVPTTIVIDGSPVKATIQKCLQPDGQWAIVR